MKKNFLMVLTLVSTLPIFGQYSRNDNQNSNPYVKSFERSSAGESFCIELKNGTLWGSGKNNYGQLGIGSTISQSSPVQIGTSNDWHIFSAGRNHTIAIKSNGTLWAWGNNGSNQLGDGTSINRNSPVQIGTDNDWIMVATGETHSMALKSNGTLWAWGNNAQGKLGTGNTTNQTTPIQIGTSSDWKSIYSGASCSYGIKANGTLWAWGYNSTNGLYGNGTTTTSYSPLQIGTDNQWIKISCKSAHVLALKTTGELLTWGNNTYGQLGNGNTITQISPVSIGFGYQDIAAGSSFSYAIKNGQLYSWGWNTLGQLGLGTTSNTNVPTLVDNTENTASISCGYYSCYRLLSNSELYSTGYNADGELGVGNTTTATNFTYRSSNTNGWLYVNLSSRGSYFIKQNGTIWMTGNDITNTPIQIGTDNDWVSIIKGTTDLSTSANHQFYALKANGTFWRYLNGTFTQLGTNRYRSIWGTTSIFTYAIGIDGTLWSVSGTTLTQESSNTDWVSADNSGLIGCLIGLKNNGTVWTYGTNSYGIYGNGTSTSNSSFNQVSTSNAIGVFACNQTAFVLLSDGTTKGWGHNTLNEIGNGTSTNASTPSTLTNGGNIIQFDVTNEGFAIAVKADGTEYYKKGYNAYGNGTNPSSTLFQNPNVSNVILANAGYYDYSSICTSSRSSICLTGSNSAGQLGDGTTTSTLYYNCGSVVALTQANEDNTSNNVSETNLGLNNYKLNNLSVYPNPSSGFISIKTVLDVIHLEILDLKGNIVYQESGESINEVNLSDLPKGSYFIRLQTKTTSEITKLILM